jgi:UDP-3-O-[3-hydroxymyristoyl] glucosamine N-acyltransferase
MVTLAEIAQFVGLARTPDATAASTIICRLSGIDDATADALVFASDERTLSQALASAAAAILCPDSLPAGADARLLAVRNPRTTFAQVYARWFDRRGRGGIHPTAMIEAGAEIGAECEIGAGAWIASGVRMGERCVIGQRVVILSGVTLGARVRVQAGAVLGSDGFGYARTREGYLGFPQIGTLWIGDDVEIGANTTIDRGALGATRIGRGTKIDNLCHIAHNCVVGEDCILAAQVGMAGSCVIEDGAMLGGQVGLGETVTIGKGVVLGGQGGLLPGKRIDGEGVVYWGTPAQPVREYLRQLARMRKEDPRR